MSADVRKTMKVSREGVVLIKSFEGFRPRAVVREDGRWVIGYGHTASAREGLSVGEADAELLLQYDLMPVVKALHERLPDGINQHQFDALASFAFSVGVEQFVASDVLGRLEAGATQEAADALIGWPVQTPVDAALRRRAAERALFVADPSAPVALSALLAAPLPPPPIAAEDSLPAIEPDATAPAAAVEDARAAAVATLLGEVEAPTAAPASAPEGGLVEAAPLQTPLAEDAGPSAGPSAANDGAPATAPTGPGFQRYLAYGPAITGALPAAGPAIPAEAFAPTLRMADPTPLPEPAPAEAIAPSAAQEAAEAEPAPQPEAASEPAPDLVLTAPAEHDGAAPVLRPAWPEAQRTGPVGDAPLFQDEPDPGLGPILRHEAEPETPRRFDWNETGAFVTMGGIGLVSFGAAMAAFRRASQQSAGGDIALIGWALAVIAALCVGVSGFHLLQKIGRSTED